MEYKANDFLPVGKVERRREKRNEKKQTRASVQRQEKIIKIIKVLVGIFLAAGLIVLGGFLFFRRTVLPPTTMVGHIERSPASHIVESPMDIRVHKHMLEHADGGGPSGVIINYNCEDYECTPDLIVKLTELVNEYPDNVYLAPYRSMSAKLVITRLGRQIVLDDYDEEEIRIFIGQ